VYWSQCEYQVAKIEKLKPIYYKYNLRILYNTIRIVLMIAQISIYHPDSDLPKHCFKAMEIKY